MMPLRTRKTAAGAGRPSTVRNVCSSSSPARPIGIVATMIIQASRSSAVSTRRYRRDVTKPVMMRNQSRQKYTSNAAAVATWSPTMNARYGDSGAATLRSDAHRPPINAGSRMLWPRLETGKSSLTPCSRPTTIASG
jgi:hypothetical protein